MHSAALRITLVGLVSIILACGGDGITPTTPDIDGVGGALTTEKKPGTGKPGKIPLIVSFDVPGLPSGAVTGDPRGDYVDGEEGVEAWIMSNGNFHLKASSGRQICFNFPSGADDPFGGSGCANGYINSGDPDVDGGLPAMTVGGLPMTSRLTVNWDGVWSLPYGYHCDSHDVLQDNRVTITRTGENPDTWTITGTNTFLCKAPTGRGKNKDPGGEVWPSLLDSDGQPVSGQMPFSLTASVKNQ